MPNGDYNGRIIRSTNPERYDAIVRAIAQGGSIRSVAKRFNCAHETILNIQHNHPDLVKSAKSLLAQTFLDVARIGAEEAQARLIDTPEKIPFNQLVLGAAIATDKSLLLQGEATERIEHVIRMEDDEFDKIIRGAKRLEVIDVDSTDVESIDKRLACLTDVSGANYEPRDDDTVDNTSIPPHPDTLKVNNEDNWQ